MCFREAPAAELSFGDFCQSTVFHDAYLRADASVLRERIVSGGFVRRQFGRDELTSYVPVDDSVPELKAQAGKDFLLAHGAPFDEAVCVSDDCEIATRLGRDDTREPTGRLLFAPVSALKEEELSTFTETNWGRTRLGDSVVELRRVFAVASEDVAGLLGGAMARRSLDDDHALRLAAWWAAYATRRGPLVDAVNLRKLAWIAEAQGDKRVTQLADALVDVLALAWRFQGRAAERAGAEYDDHHDEPSIVNYGALLDLIRADFADLDAAVATARGLLA